MILDLSVFQSYWLRRTPSFLSYFFQIFYKYFWIFKFEYRKWRKVPEFHFPVTSGNEIFSGFPAESFSLGWTDPLASPPQLQQSAIKNSREDGGED